MRTDTHKEVKNLLPIPFSPRTYIVNQSKPLLSLSSRMLKGAGPDIVPSLVVTSWEIF